MKIKNNYGVAIRKIINHYHCHFERAFVSQSIAYYLQMPRLELDNVESEFREDRRVTRRAFYCHPSVPWFLSVNSFSAGFMLVTSGQAPSIWWAILTAMTAALCFWMTRARRALFAALVFLKQELEKIEAARAVRDARVRFGSESRPMATELPPAPQLHMPLLNKTDLGRFGARCWGCCCVLVGLLFGLLAGNVNADTITGRVVGISDGDTITVLSHQNEQFKVRLSGIDAPEKAQPFGQRSKEKMSDLVFDKPVTVEWSKRDRYQRIIGKVIVANQDAGLALISSGLAWHYKKYEKEQGVSDRERYATAEEAARSKRIGLWSDANPVPPWEWRAEKRGR